MLNRRFLTFKVKVTDCLRTLFTALINSYGPAAVLCQNSGGHQTQKQECNTKLQHFLQHWDTKHNQNGIVSVKHKRFITKSEKVYLFENHQAEKSWNIDKVVWLQKYQLSILRTISWVCIVNSVNLTNSFSCIIMLYCIQNKQTLHIMSVAFAFKEGRGR